MCVTDLVHSTRRYGEPPGGRCAARAGMTLVELLVVIAIMMILVLVALPAMSPTKESRELREAARSVDLFFGASRNQAMALGRPCGVLLQRLPARPEACTTLYPVEEPPPYTGEFMNSKVNVMLTSLTNTLAIFRMQGTQRGTIAPGMVRIGDRIQFNQQGPYYVISNGTRQTSSIAYVDGSIVDPFELRFERTDMEVFPWTTRPTEANFRIIRQPRRTAGDPLELPVGTAIDLFLSRIQGVPGENAFFRLNTTYRRSAAGDPDDSPVIIMFSPNGGVDQLYRATTRDSQRRPLVVGEPVSGMIALLIGQRSRILGLDANGTPLRPADDLLNDSTRLPNYWITISPRTGLTVAKEIAAGILGGATGGR